MSGVVDLAFPYIQSEQRRHGASSVSSPVELHKLTLINQGNSKYNFQLQEVDGKRKCVAISKVDSNTKLPIKDPLSYIDNTSSNPTTPLLIRCNPQFNRIRLQVSTGRAVSLIIVKSKDENDDVSSIQSILKDGNAKSNEFMEISKISLNDTEELVTIKDSFDSTLFNNGILNLFVFKIEEEQYVHCFDFKLWICKQETNDTVLGEETVQEIKEPEPEVQVGDYKTAFNFILDDGPEFRKALQKNESRIPTIQKNTSILVEELKYMEANLKRLINNKNKIIDLIYTFSSLSPVLSKFKFRHNFKNALNSIVNPFEVNLRFFFDEVCQKKLLDKISQVANFDDEKTELSKLKKNFESQSNSYYSWLKKYLSNEKERPESKLLSKRKTFELSKFDYLNYLNNFTNNQYFNELLENLFKFTSIDFSRNSDPAALNINKVGLNNYYQIYLNVLLKYNSEKFKLRQMIETCPTNDELTNLVRFNNLTADSKIDHSTVVTQDNLDMIFSPVTPIEETSVASPESPTADQKSGILYTLGGKGKQGWHKEWVVVRDGELKEFSDWRTGSDPVNNSIQVALSNVKPTSHDKRQNCFEIFTNAGNKYTFQAINENERNDWIKVLNNSKQLIDADRLKENYKSDKTHSKDGSRLKKLHLKLDKPNLSINPNHGTPSEIFSPVSMKSNSVISKDYLKTVRSIAGSNNNICADCETSESVEWISINFLVVLCINCSSHHRNLGSHVSKVRSLKLDNFNDKETEILLNYINNKNRNQILEQNCQIDKGKLDNNRLQFIKDKYQYKKFASLPENATDKLIDSVQNVNLEDVIKYVLLGANPNVQISSKAFKEEVSLFVYSLRKYLIIETDEGPKEYFVISEFLLLNGAKMPKFTTMDGLNDRALSYWSRKYSRLT